jgi:hypothetical protein
LNYFCTLGKYNYVLINCSKQAIKALFPPDSHPFYAGFGNRDTDELSYLKVGIPMGKIFIINPKVKRFLKRQKSLRHSSRTKLLYLHFCIVVQPVKACLRLDPNGISVGKALITFFGAG